MDEPQDHRIELPWRAQGGHLWTVPREEGAGSIGVTNAPLTPPALAEYVAGVHNQHLHQRTQLPVDSSAAADGYMAEQWTAASPNDTVVLERVRDGYVDGYKAGWRTGVHLGNEEAGNDQKLIQSLREEVRALAQTADRLARERDDALAAWRASQQENQRLRAEMGLTHKANLRLQESLSNLSERHQELETAHADLADDARVAASLSSTPGARQAAQERIRRQSGAVQDHLDEFEQEVAAPRGLLGEQPSDESITAAGGWVAPVVPQIPEISVNRGGIEFPPVIPGLYDKGQPLPGVGHHSPSYAEGYRIGRSDTVNGFRGPMSERDQALYAAHLLLTEAVAAHEETRIPWQQATRRWQEGYLGLVNGEDT